MAACDSVYTIQLKAGLELRQRCVEDNRDRAAAQREITSGR